MALAPVQKIYGDAAHRNFAIQKNKGKGAPIVRQSDQTLSSEAITLVGNTISL